MLCSRIRPENTFPNAAIKLTLSAPYKLLAKEKSVCCSCAVGEGFNLAEPKLLLYPLLVEPDDPAVADLYHRHPRLPGLADHVSCCLRVALQVHGLL